MMAMRATMTESLEESSQPGVLLKVTVRRSTHGILWYDRWSHMLVQAPEETMARMQVHYPPFYMESVSLTRIRQILPSMGLREDMNVVLVAGESLEVTGKNGMSRRELVWRRSQEVARIAEFVALWINSGISPEEAFRAGLLHDCALAMMTREGVTHHARAGELMARIWEESQPVCQAIRFHHEAGVELLESLDEPRIWLVLRLADCLHDVLAGKGMPHGNAPNQPTGNDLSGRTVDALTALGLRGHEMRDLMEDAAKLIGLEGNVQTK